MELERLNLNSKSGTEVNLEALYQICPACFTEAKDEKTGGLRRVVDFNKLKEFFGETIAEDVNEAYEFTWVGKNAAKREAATSINKTLRPCVEESVDWDATKNIYIEGDNLEVLKLLQNSYAGKVKVIYIDPPYNTGNDFIYHDDFAQDRSEYDLDAGNVDDEGNRYLKNTETNGRFHSDWCSMIYSRLLLARNLLTGDGAVFISIDDNEVENLKKICDEIFGETNFLAQLSVIVKTEGRQYGHFAKTHEYLLVYAKSYIDVQLNEVKVANASFKYSDKKGGFNTIGLRNRAVRIFNSTNRPNLRYPFYVDLKTKDAYGFSKVSTIPIDGWREVWPSVVDGLESVWRWGKETAEKNKDELVALQGNDGEIRIFKKDRDLTTLPKTVWFEKEYNSIVGTREVASIVGKGLFDFPKPTSLLKRILEVATMEDSLVLDFFSGSSTTAHAVMQLNAEDDGQRKFIMVQLPEECDETSEAYKAGYKNICEIGKERIRRAGQKIKNEAGLVVNELDVGFRVFKCDESNMKDVYFEPKDLVQSELLNFMDNIKEDRTDLDLLFDYMLKRGVQLSEPMTKNEIDGCTVYNVNDGNLVACFSEKVSEDVISTIAEMEPLRVVFRDSSFDEASKKMNLFEIFKQKCGWSDEEVRKNVKVI